MADCVACDRPQVADQAYACRQCASRLYERLTAAADLVPELDTTLARQTRYGDPGPRPRNSAPAEPVRLGLSADPATDHQDGPAGGLPFSEAASIVGGTVTNTVSTWARLVGAERFPGSAPAGPVCLECEHPTCERLHAWRRWMPPPTDLAAAMRWLAGQVEWMRHQRWVAEAVDELEHAAGLVARAVDRPVERRYLGPCGIPDGLAGACPGELYAHQSAERVKCQTCGHSHEVSERRDWLDGLVREHTYTAAEIAAAYPHVRADRIRQWASRGRVVSHGSDRYGRPLYRLEAVLELAAHTQRPGASRRIGVN